MAVKFKGIDVSTYQTNVDYKKVLRDRKRDNEWLCIYETYTYTKEEKWKNYEIGQQVK